LASRLGISTFLNGIKDSAEYLRLAADMTPGLKDAGGWDYIRRTGVWFDEGQQAAYRAYARELRRDELLPRSDGERIVEDPATGTVYRLNARYPDGYEAPEQYVGIKNGGRYYLGFRPDGFLTSGRFEIRSHLLASKGYPAMPDYWPIPAHWSIGEDNLILTTFKVNVHSGSRTQNSKWLQEISHENTAWIHPTAARSRGISDGDLVEVASPTGSIRIKAHVTEGIHPSVVSVASHGGHWEYGRYASGRRSPGGQPDKEDRRIWWTTYGSLANLVIPITTDPVGGAQAYMDTVVKVSKVK
jgi:thiosulfate reductase / polysulfide reductase chain A